jgi:hypothetical protein
LASNQPEAFSLAARFAAYEFSTLTSGRDLLRLQVKRESKEEGKQENGQSAMVVANPDFGEEKESKAQERILKYRPGTKSMMGEGAVLASFYFPPLIGTAEEARSLKIILSDATVLVRGQATEAALKRMEHPRILRIATHGFFLDNQSPAVHPAKDGCHGLRAARSRQ